MVYFSGRCPALRSYWSQGKTKGKAFQNIREAVELYLEPNPSELEGIAAEKIVELA